jgi:DNA-binding NtrC family response regulator
MELWLPRVPSLLEPQAEQSEVRPGLSLAGRRVLVVDDDPNVARAAERILEQLGCASTVLHSSVVALKTFSAERFDAAIVDRIMPELSGDELVQEIRAVAPRFPIVIVSGYSDLPSRYDTPFVQFVPKPFTLRSLRSALLKVIDQSS